MLAYIQIFCRCVILLVFAISFGSKVRHAGLFQQTILSFALLPQRLTLPAAWFFLLLEALVVVLVALAGPFLVPGYLLAGTLLLLFSLALLSVLLRRISATCSCFGPTRRVVSASDVVRNVGFIVCALGGYLTLLEPTQKNGLDLLAWLPGILGALIFVGIWTQLGEIVHLFR